MPCGHSRSLRAWQERAQQPPEMRRGSGTHTAGHDAVVKTAHHTTGSKHLCAGRGRATARGWPCACLLCQDVDHSAHGSGRRLGPASHSPRSCYPARRAGWVPWRTGCGPARPAKPEPKRRRAGERTGDGGRSEQIRRRVRQVPTLAGPLARGAVHAATAVWEKLRIRREEARRPRCVGRPSSGLISHWPRARTLRRRGRPRPPPCGRQGAPSAAAAAGKSREVGGRGGVGGARGPGSGGAMDTAEDSRSLAG